jgi:predicted RNase H-like nuclease (RuvC/YqgF family)
MTAKRKPYKSPHQRKAKVPENTTVFTECPFCAGKQIDLDKARMSVKYRDEEAKVILEKLQAAHENEANSDRELTKRADRIEQLTKWLANTTTAHNETIGKYSRLREMHDIWRGLFFVILGLFTVAIVLAASLVHHAF